MILTQDMIDKVGAAVNAGRSLFLYGAPGNGKSMLAERIGKMLGGSIAVPYAIEADGQIIQFFDLNLHRPVPFQTPTGGDTPGLGGIPDPRTAEYADHRWVQTQRPVVVVGGELTMDSLDLIYHQEQRLLRGALPAQGQQRRLPHRRLRPPADDAAASCSTAGSCRWRRASTS